MRPDMPLLFLFGPSGSGKSTLSRYLAQAVVNVILLEDFPERIAEVVALQRAGKSILENPHPDLVLLDSLVAQITSYVASVEVGRLVAIEIQSDIYPSHNALLALETLGVCALVLYAQAQACLKAFLDREKLSDRGLTQEHWIQFNPSPEKFASPALKPWTVTSCDKDLWVSPQLLLSSAPVEKILKRHAQRITPLGTPSPEAVHQVD